MLKEFDRKLIFEDGSEYFGYSFGSRDERICEIVFNTSVVGYQEIMSDPSYTYQAVVMTYPLIGNYGMAREDYETEKPTLGAFILSEYNDEPSNFRSEKTLGEVMSEYNIPGIYGIDTRKLTRYIREKGSKKVLLADASLPLEEGLKRLSESSIPSNAVSLVSPKEIKSYFPEGKSEFKVVAIDCGMKENILRSLLKRRCEVIRVPFNTSAKDIKAFSPDGIFISNGPGNPEDVGELIETIRELLGKYPIFGICLGHQIISLASGGSCYKLKFGHRGGNHPVKNLKNGKIEITSQNHSYAVREESLKNTSLTVTHINLLDGTVEGVESKEKKVFSVQYHPESAPGPEDSGYLFDEFIELMKGEKGNA